MTAIKDNTDKAQFKSGFSRKQAKRMITSDTPLSMHKGSMCTLNCSRRVKRNQASAHAPLVLADRKQVIAEH